MLEDFLKMNDFGYRHFFSNFLLSHNPKPQTRQMRSSAEFLVRTPL